MGVIISEKYTFDKELFEKSIRLITYYQANSGAFIASPDFAQYNFCWIRDATFIAYALDVWGYHRYAHKYYMWVRSVLDKKIDDIKSIISDEHEISSDDPRLLPARFSLAGEALNDDWPNFQLDGYGTLLWGLTEHIKLSQSYDASMFSELIYYTSAYLKHLWNHPCYDCWEENGDKIHASTLACIAGGLKAVSEIPGVELPDNLNRTIGEIYNFITTRLIKDGHFVKHEGSLEVDASLMWLCTPFNIFDVNNTIFDNTLTLIESELGFPGVRRYPSDVYYGGGRWPLLTCLLGICAARDRQLDKAIECLNWVEAQASPAGELPEQVEGEIINPEAYKTWVASWGPPARLLLWSHAMYLILLHQILNSLND